MSAADFGPLDAALRAAVLRGDTQQEKAIEQAAATLAVPPGQMPAERLPVALWYANRGLRVFPLAEGLKRPLPGSRGVHDATADPEIIGRMFGHGRAWTPDRGPNDHLWNMGVATGDPFDVIDIDGPEGATAFIKTLGSDPTLGAWLTVAGVTQTPRGYHLWVPTTGAPNGAWTAGIDYRGKGGYVVVPPSHVDGTLYRWLLPPVT